jgi:hypothetical protein
MKFCSVCGSVGSIIGLLISLFMRIIVHWVEFCLINWLLCNGVEGNIISIAKNK